MLVKRLLLVVVISLITATTGFGNSVNLLPGAVCPNQDVGCSIPSTATLSALDPTFVLPNDPGVVHLPIFVVPGDVVLFETPNGSLGDTSTWSDVVEFHDIPGVHGSFATTFPDAEPVGIILPPGFTPSFNAVGVLETQTGVGSDAVDFTTYVAGTGDFSATYQIHSDCAGTTCEVPDVETPEPSLMGLLGLGFGGLVLGAKLKSRQV